jgi:D-amino-acid dehydrogenase
MKTVCVIGAGFVGAACAWQLQRSGFQVQLLDRSLNDASAFSAAASWGNAGHLAIEQTQPLANWANVRSLPSRLFSVGGPVGLPLRDINAWLPFGLRLMNAVAPAKLAQGQAALSDLLARAMPAWQRLTQQTGTSQYLAVEGHYVAWESTDSARKGIRHWLDSDMGLATARMASADELAILKQQFNQRPVAALRIEGSGQVLDVGQSRAEIIQAFLAAGGSCVAEHALRIESSPTYTSIHLANGEELRTDMVVVAAGVESSVLLQASVGRVPLIAERGYHIESAVSGEDTSNRLPPVAFEDRSVIVTRFNHTLRLAGFTEFARRQSPPDARKWQALEKHAAALGLPLSPSLSPSSTRWMGARPTLPDYLPAIGRSHTMRNVMYAVGHQHLGLTLAAITGELIAGLAQHIANPSESIVPEQFDSLQAFNDCLAPFDAARFQY